jgi:hypothetical protein
MLDKDLVIGDLVFTKSLASFIGNKENSITMNYKTDRKSGKLFALMLIGIEDPETFGVKEAKERMEELGWAEKK